MSDNEFRLPDLGEGLRDAEIVQWHVAPGDHVVADQPLVSVETDKAVVEVPSPRSGHIRELGAEEGDRLEVGEVLVVFSAGAHADSGAVVGELPRAPAIRPAVEAPAPASGNTLQHLRASPAARKLAHDLRLELETINGSGPDGVISVADVQRAAESERPAEAGRGEALHGARRAMARRMAEAHQRVVPASLTRQACVGAWFGRERPLLRLVRALVHACQVEPALNRWFDDEHELLHDHDSVNVGLAVDTADGLFVPVLHDAGNLDDATLLQRIEELRAAVVSRAITAADMHEATISLSNFGALGGETAQMVVAPPQVAILGAGRIAAQVLARDGAAVIDQVMPLSLTFDHRVVTGGEATRFLEAVRAHLETEQSP
jgi:2-oxoisovalerate dehydrogenase E2 component (dihydrolipoyl transacylase)